MGAVNDVRAAGHEVTAEMINMAKNEAYLGKDMSMQEQIHRVLLREAAVQSALKEASQSGIEVHGRFDTWAKESEARLSAARTSGSEYEAMFANALRALNSERSVYVVTVSGYKRAGLDLILSLSSLGEDFQMMVKRETSVAQVTYLVQQDRLQKRPAGPGKTIEVKLVGPAGTLLPREKLITHALDYEADEVLSDDENGTFYPLSVLTGERWKDMGLSGPTRWKHLHEKDFRNLFGMSKDAFEQLPDWKQIPLKKKHSLF